jgi:hypothetical protein
MRRLIAGILCVLALLVSLLSCVSYEEFTYARSGNVESANDVTSIEVAKPGNTVEGDLLIGVVITDGDTSGEFTGPTGWTLIDVGWSGNDSYGGGCTLGAWYLTAGDSEPGSYQWTWTTEETVYAFIIRITGHDMDNPIDAWSSDTGTDGFSATCPGVNTAVADSLVLRIFGYDSCCGWNAKYPNKHIGITVESSRPGCESGAVGHCSGGAAYTAQETAGDTGTAVFKVNQGEGLYAWRTLTIAVRPAAVQYDLTMAANPEVGGTATDLTSESPYEEGTVVSIKAEANEGYEFVNWTAPAGVFDNASAAETTFTMPAQNVIVTANFELAPTILVLLPESDTNPVDTTHDLTATVKDQFNNVMAGVDVTWDISGVGSFSGTPESQTDVNGEADAVITSSEPGTSTVTCEVTGNPSVADTATKGWTSVAVYDLTMAANPEVGGTATDLTNESPYAEGAEVSIKAEANEGYEFVNWTATEGVFDNATAAETTFTMPAQNVAVTANFEEVPPPPEAPKVITQTATTITTKSTNLNMDYTTGDFSPVEVRFAYKKSTGSAWFYTDWVPKSADGTYTAQLTGLSSNTEYDFKAELKYASSVIESAIIQFITKTSSLSPSQGCFIATAAYDTPTAEQIDVLREFRDTVLLKNNVGSQFVTLYYQFSPPIADFIAGNELLRTLVRELLIDPIVWVVEATGDIWRN